MGQLAIQSHHFHCGHFVTGVAGKEYVVRANRIREGISYHHLRTAMLEPLKLDALDPREMCGGPEIAARPPRPPRPPGPPYPTQPPNPAVPPNPPAPKEAAAVPAGGRAGRLRRRRGLSASGALAPPLARVGGGKDAAGAPGFPQRLSGSSKPAAAAADGAAATSGDGGKARRAPAPLLGAAAGEQEGNDWFCPELPGGARVKDDVVWDVLDDYWVGAAR